MFCMYSHAGCMQQRCRSSCSSKSLGLQEGHRQDPPHSCKDVMREGCDSPGQEADGLKYSALGRRNNF
jgi:hypothetical protein